MSYDQQQPWPPAQPQQGGYYPPPPPGNGQPPQRRRPRRRHRALRILGAAGGVFVLIGVIAAIANGGKAPQATPGTPAAATAAATAAARTSAPSVPKPAAAKPHTVATFTGSGTETTRKFTVTATWKLTYRFSCAGFGQSGNFQVFEDGGADPGGITVNELAMSKSGSSWAYGDAGKHYLEMNSECSWTVKVTDEPSGG